MALNITIPVATLLSTDNISAYSTNNFTPSADSILVVFVRAFATTTGVNILSGGNLTWNLIASTVPYAAATVQAEWIFYAAVGSSPVFMNVMFDCTGDQGTGCAIQIFQVTGYNIGSPIAQFSSGSEGSTSNPTFTLSQNMNTNNAYMYVVANSNSLNATAPSGWTEAVDDITPVSPSYGLQAAYRVNGESGNTVLPVFTGGTPSQFGFVEVAVSGAPLVAYIKAA